MYHTISGETLDGLLPQPITYTAEGAQPLVRCFWLLELEGGEFATLAVDGDSGNGAEGDLATRCFEMPASSPTHALRLGHRANGHTPCPSRVEVSSAERAREVWSASSGCAGYDVGERSDIDAVERGGGPAEDHRRVAVAEAVLEDAGDEVAIAWVQAVVVRIVGGPHEVIGAELLDGPLKPLLSNCAVEKMLEAK